MSPPLPQTVKGDTAVERLANLGLELPLVAANAYYVDHNTVGESIHISGQLPFRDGKLLDQGIVGRDVDLETGKELARHAALNCLAAAVQAVGDLDKVRVVQMLVFVASLPDFGLQSKVAEGASELLIEVLGENGRHSRTAIGVAGLPLNTPVEIQMICAAASPGPTSSP
jgi:enamine deaminase RidA (YjgF/YER057c/UK114 family)